MRTLVILVASAFVLLAILDASYPRPIAPGISTLTTFLERP